MHARNRIVLLAMTLAFALLGCSDGKASELDTQETAADTHPLPSDIDEFDAAICDPSVFEQPLDPSRANIASALDPYCFNTGDGRRALVIEALCARDKACGVRHVKDCPVEHEARWQEGLRPRGRSVPCADALLDSMSCLAQASCDETHSCDAWDERAEVACDPNRPRLGAPMCPPLPDDRELTKGPIPDDAINDAGMLDQTRIPDFVPAWNNDEIAGYVRYCALSAGGAVPVYGEDLKTVVGYMIPGRGFVPGDLR